MTKIRYQFPSWLRKWLNNDNDTYNLSTARQEKISTIITANKILDEYEEQGYTLTLRQLYYQFVKRNLISNTDGEYKRFGTIISDGRLWGLIDWSQLIDRHRQYIEQMHWDDPAELIKATIHSYHVDRWIDSKQRFEVWVEKQALEQIVGRACKPHDVGYIACKGYMSQSQMWAAAQRLIPFQEKGQQVTILHLGDHRPQWNRYDARYTRSLAYVRL